MKVIKSKGQLMNEPQVIQKMQIYMNDSYAGKAMQPELKKALPIFIDNTLQSYKEQDLISSDLLGTDQLNDWLAIINDTYEQSMIVATVIQAFSDLNTKGVEFDVCYGDKCSVQLKDKRKVFNLSSIAVSYTFKPDGTLDEKMEDFCVALTEELQKYVDRYQFIVLNSFSAMKTYTGELLPQIIITFKMLGYRDADKVNRIKDKDFVPHRDLPSQFDNEETLDASGYETIHEEAEEEGDFMTNFKSRKGIAADKESAIEEYKVNSIDDSEDVKIEELPETPQKEFPIGIRKPVGAYVMAQSEFHKFEIPMFTKPSAWRRFWTKAFIGVTWIDYNENSIYRKMNDGINKIGEFNGIPVYHDEYMSENEFRCARGPKYPDQWYVGPAIYVDGRVTRPDGSPLHEDVADLSYETKFILTGATMDYIEKNEDIINNLIKGFKNEEDDNNRQMNK